MRFVNEHSALDDTRNTALVFIQMLQEGWQPNNQSTNVTAGELAV